MGASALLLERGDFPGAKNMFGGAIYREPMQEVISDFIEHAPLERTIVGDELWLMEEDSAVKVGFQGLRFAKPPYNKFSVLRARFDRWMAQQAVEKGARLENRALAQRLLFERRPLGQRGPVCGVELSDGEKIYAPVVILAEGVNAFLTKQAGLRGPIPAHTLTLYAKEVLSLPAATIEERFGLEAGHGAVIGMVGWATGGIIGKAGIWTNRDSISLIVGGYLNQMADNCLSPCDLLQRLKQHPLIKRLIHGAQTEEYMAHLIPKGGYNYQPQLFDHGVLVTGDAGVMVSGRRGTDLAMLSGKMAAETAVQAKARGDFSKAMLSNYKHSLDRTYFMKDIRANKNDASYTTKYRDSDFILANTANKVAMEFFREDMLSEPEKAKRLRDIVLSQQHILKSFVDIYQGIKYWGAF
jgi:electron transfer flavoprotein-quinone oxidoreductase